MCRNQHIAVGHFLSEARTTKTPGVADAGRTAKQIIAGQNANKGNKATNRSSAGGACSAVGVNDRPLHNVTVPEGGRSGRKSGGESNSAGQSCGCKLTQHNSTPVENVPRCLSHGTEIRSRCCGAERGA